MIEDRLLQLPNALLVPRGDDRAPDLPGRLQQLENAAARRVGERLEAVHEDHGEAPSRERGAHRLGKPEAIRKLGQSHLPTRSVSRLRGAVT